MIETVQKNENKNNLVYSTEDRPSWHEYFLLIAHAVSLRSDDRFIKHGAVIVEDLSNHIVGTGYNNTIRGMPKSISCPEDREYRRRFMKHAEYNAILNCNADPVANKSSFSIFVTAKPCLDCLETIIQFGIKNIIYCNKNGSILEDKESEAIRQKIYNHYEYFNKIKVLEYNLDNTWIQKGLKLLEPI